MTQNTFLTQENIEELTGYVQRSAQSRWLEQQGIVHYVNSKGEVKTTWFNVNHPTHLRHNTEEDTPDFTVFEHGTTSH